MHISEQRIGDRTGAHSDYVKTIPKVLLDFPKKYGMNLDLMVEVRFEAEVIDGRLRAVSWNSLPNLDKKKNIIK